MIRDRGPGSGKDFEDWQRNPQPFSFMCPARLGYCTFDSTPQPSEFHATFDLLRRRCHPGGHVSTKHLACESHLLLFAFSKCEPEARPQVFPNQVLTTNRISEVANRNLHGFGRRYPKN